MSHGTIGNAVDTEADARFELGIDPDETTHVVCCRDPDWRVAFCGYEGSRINMAATVLCAVCLEIAEKRLAGWSDHHPPLCPNDADPCPDEHEIDLRILREVSP